MGTTTSLRSRVDNIPVAALLAVGDAVALSAFFAVGAHHHGLAPLSNPTVVVGSATPFLLTWALAGVVADLFSAQAVETSRRVLARTVPAWLLAGLAGQGLRATDLFRGTAATSFVAVTLLVGGVFVVGWRAVFGTMTGRK